MTPSNQHLERETLLFYHLSPIYIHQKSQDLPGSNVQFLRLVHPLNPSVLWFYGSLGVLVSNNTNVKNKASKKHQNKNNYRFRPNHGPHPVPPASALAPYLNNKRAPESDFLCCCWDHRTVSQRNQIWLYIISTLYVYIYKHPLSYSFSKENERIHRNSLLKSNWKLGACSLGVVRSVPWPSQSFSSKRNCNKLCCHNGHQNGTIIQPNQDTTVNLLCSFGLALQIHPFGKLRLWVNLPSILQQRITADRARPQDSHVWSLNKRHWKSLCTGIIKYKSLGSPQGLYRHNKKYNNIMYIYIYLKAIK